MKVTWDDFAAHRHAATPVQWRRMEAYFRQGKTIAGVAADEGVGGKHSSSVGLSIGRGCIAIIRSMLGQPVRIPSESATAIAMRKVRAELTLEKAAVSSPGTCEPPMQYAAENAVPPREPIAGASDATPLKAPLLSMLSEAQINAMRSPSQTIAIGMRVEGQNKAGRDTGRVEKLDGEMAVVVWDSGFKSFASIAQLTPLSGYA